MPRVVYDPSVSSIVVDLLLEAADGQSSVVIPVVLSDSTFLDTSSSPSAFAKASSISTANAKPPALISPIQKRPRGRKSKIQNSFDSPNS
jgi:hypothetical protein